MGPHKVTDDSFVLLSAQSNIATRSLWYTIDAPADRFTIRMSSKRARPTRISWLMLD
jgi:hypothetical protein